MRRPHRAVGRWLAVALLAATAASCAFYNTFYKAKDYYSKATLGAPYVLDAPDGTSVSNFGKSIDYSKKLLAGYPKSKWVDDAYLLWARGLLGKDDPLQTMNMLRDFGARYPQSPLKDDALFYMGVAGRKARKYVESLAALDEFLQRAPKNDLVPYALIERARVLVALDRPGDAAASASEMLDRFRKHPERDRALQLRAEALLAQGEYERARGDYKLLGVRAATDEGRFGFLLKEADCLEAGRRYDDELTLLQSALGHEQEPVRPQDGTFQQVFQPNPGSVDRWGRLMLRVGTAQALAGRKELALSSYKRVVDGFPRTSLAAEAQYRTAYVHETIGDDFETARTEYAKVSPQSPTSPFAAQAGQRLTNLDRLIQYRSSAGPDSLGKKAETGLLLAELYLFQLDKPDRALEEYRKVSGASPGTPYAGKALNAEAWVLRNKFHRDAEADSLLWVVVRGYPKTEAQVDARDYLERYGHPVPAELIQLPDPPVVVPDTTRLTPLPSRVDSIGVRHTPSILDSLLRYGSIRAGEPPVTPTRPPVPRAPAPPDSSSRPAVADTTRATLPDSLRGASGPALPDTTRRHP